MRRLPDGTPISVLGFGCSSYWANKSFSESRAVELVLRANERGLNHFDTGPSYADGNAEKRLGVALREMDRSKTVISSKVGTFCDKGGKRFKSFDPVLIRSSVRASLDRLGLTQLDILYLHGPRTSDLNSDVVDCLASLKKEGLIRHSGVNSFDKAVLNKVVPMPFDVVMPQYNIFDVSCRDQVIALKSAGKTVVGATALGQGIVSLTSLLPSNPKKLWYLLRLLKNDPLFLFTRAGARGRLASFSGSALQGAISFLLQTPELTSSIFGTTSLVHLMENLDAATAPEVSQSVLVSRP